LEHRNPPLLDAPYCSALLLVAKLEHVFEKATRLICAIVAIAIEGENILRHMRFDAPDSCLILACAKGAPLSVLYWGAALPLGVDVAELARLSERQGMHGVADMSLPLPLAMEPGLGHPMFHGFAAHLLYPVLGLAYRIGCFIFYLCFKSYGCLHMICDQITLFGFLS
jgi:hypothetical protein